MGFNLARVEHFYPTSEKEEMKTEDEFRSGRRRTNALGFSCEDEVYAMAMLVVVKAHQSRAVVGMPSSSPGSFVITMAPTCDRPFPQKPMESVGATCNMSCIGLTL